MVLQHPLTRVVGIPKVEAANGAFGYVHNENHVAGFLAGALIDFDPPASSSYKNPRFI